MRRSWFIAAVVIGVAAIVIAALAMRLTADDESQPSATAWADSVCTSLTDWRTSIESIADVSGGLTAESLQERVDAASDATNELVSDLQDLGPPDLESGDQLEEQLDESVGALESSFDELKAGAESAADAPPGEFLQQLADLAGQFQAFMQAVSDTVDTLRDANVAEDAKAELQQAFDDADSCQALRAES